MQVGYSICNGRTRRLMIYLIFAVCILTHKENETYVSNEAIFWILEQKGKDVHKG